MSKQTDPNQTRDWEKRNALAITAATIVIAIATVAGVVVSLKQWHALRSSDEAIREQATIMRGQLNEMRVQSAVTKFQLRANPNVILDERDILGPKNEFLGRLITPHWKNLGSTDTVEFSGWANGHFFIPDIPSDFDFSRLEADRRPGDPPPVAATSISISIPQNGEYLQVSIPFMSDDIVKALAGTGIFYLWLSVQYRDVFPDTAPHHVTQCVRVIPRMLGDKLVFAYPLYKPECNRRD